MSAGESTCEESTAEVRAFYERHPYPEPLTDLSGYRERWEKGSRRRAEFHLLWPHTEYRSDIEVLVAGCGTSQAARHALREPGSKVTGIDVSEASLAHTRSLQQQHGIDNLELLRLNLEEVDSLGRRFDKIVCTGVLHHLPDPDAGLRALRGALKPGGVMQLMVYATYGRTGVYMLQEFCRLLGVRPSESDLADLAATIGAISNDHPLAFLMRQAKDFGSAPALADALLNPQDRAYTVPQLYDWLERCDCAFGRWTRQAPYLANCGAVAQTPHAERLSALPAPQQHAALELFRGTMAMHEFSARAKDEAASASAIRFDDESVLDLVPIRVPGTLTVTERLPAGAAAVLINPGHHHTDIYLPIDAAEKKLLNVINGRRSVASLLRKQANARDFIERLWQYDQIVFDASAT